MKPDCKVCCNLNTWDKSTLNNNKNFCNQLIYSDNYTFWLEQNRNYQKYLYLNKKLNCSEKNCNSYKQNSTIPKKQYIEADKYFSSYEDFLNYQRGNEILKGNPSKNRENIIPTPFIGNPYP